jgi:hypothetical protein
LCVFRAPFNNNGVIHKIDLILVGRTPQGTGRERRKQKRYEHGGMDKGMGKSMNMGMGMEGKGTVKVCEEKAKASPRTR